MGIADQVAVLHPYISQGRSHYIAFSKKKGHEALAKLFSDTMAAFKQTPQYSELLLKYGLEAE